MCVDVNVVYLCAVAVEPRQTRQRSKFPPTTVAVRETTELPDEPDEHFYNELMYILCEDEINGKFTYRINYK